MEQLYRGFVETRDKACVEKFKGRADLKTYGEVKDLPEFAGILAEGVVLVDVDDAEQSEKLLRMVDATGAQCRVVRTSRGRHFMFVNDGVERCGTHRRLACGLTADIKLGSRNSYQVLKVGGVEREVEREGPVGPLPKWLRPVAGGADFAGMEPGQGRNQAMFNYILTLTAAGFSKDEARECIRLINSHALAEPLGDDELDTVLRDEAFPEDVFYDGKRFCHERFAQFLIAEDKVKRINGQLHMFDGSSYVAGYRHIENRMIQHIPTLKAQARAEVLKYLEVKCAADTPCADANLVAFANGVLDLATGSFRPVDAETVIVNRIPWDYRPDAYSEVADRTLDKLACGDPDIRALLEECVGYCFYRRNELSKAFVLTGDKSNGKSTFLDVVKRVLGPENYSALDMAELDERFSVATMAGKLANIGDDISDEFMQGRSVAVFKKIVSGNEVKAELKGQDAFFFSPYVKLLFSANDIPRIRDKTGAVLRRLVIVPFRATFSKADPDFDPYITYKLKAPEVMEYMCRLGVEGLRRVLANNAFTESARVAAEIADYEVSNNPLLMFLQEREEWELLNQPTKNVHRAYSLFCAENGFGPMSLISFTKTINKRLGFTTRRVRVNGRLESVFEREGVTM